MSPAVVLIELAEKMALLAAAALVAVLFPPLRNRILGLGGRRDKAVGLVFGLGLAIWGSMLSLKLFGEHMNVRAIGVIIAALLGGRKSGAAAGLVGGLFSATRNATDAAIAPWVVTASVTDGIVAGLVAKRWPRLFTGWRAFTTSVAIQAFHIVIVGAGLFLSGELSRYVGAWPVHLIKIGVNAAGVTLFVVVARLVVAREESAIALGEARAAADAAALEALRRRLEPHFLFNALTALRAVIRRDPARARELVADLADLYRYLLSHPEDATLREETAHAMAYLAIERTRLGDERLAVSADLAPDCENVRVPALLLQPLVENAVRHGVTAHAGPGSVHVTARREGGEIRIEVADRYSGAPRTPTERGSGLALRTLRERLRKRFGERATLALEPDADGTRAVVRIPAPKEGLAALAERAARAAEAPPARRSPA